MVLVLDVSGTVTQATGHRPLLQLTAAPAQQRVKNKGVEWTVPLSRVSRHRSPILGAYGVGHTDPEPTACLHGPCT